MVKQLGKSGKLQTVYWSLVSMVSAALISVQPVMADTIWDRFSTIMKDVYGEIVAISTIVAVTVAAIALVVRMVSRNQRAVDEAGFLERFAARSGERLPLTAGEIDEMELRFPRDRDVRLDFLRLRSVSMATSQVR